MNWNPTISALSFLPVPTLTQTAAAGTIAFISVDVFDKLYDKINYPLLKLTFQCLGNLSVCILASTGIATIWIVAKKHYPAWSHLALLAIVKPMFKAYTNYMTISIDKGSEDPMRDVARYAFVINVIATTALLYQQRSLLRAFHLTALAASSLYFYKHL